MYTYSENAEKGFNYLSNTKNQGRIVEFDKLKARDNSMYNINEGNNLELK